MMQNQTNLKKKVNNSLNTDEILGILRKANKDFTKETHISGKISNTFQRTDIIKIARKNSGTEQDITSESKVKNEAKKNNQPDETKSKDSEKKLETEIKPKLIKKYTEQEADLKAKELAKKYYYHGYNLGVKNIKKELQKGENNLAITLKNTIDNLFFVSKEFTEKLSREINISILKLCKEIIGYEISLEPGKFNQKVSKLADLISNSTNKINVFLNPEDLKIIAKYLESHKPNTDINLKEDSKLERGDIKISSGEIEIEEIFSKKIVFNDDFEIGNQSHTPKKK